MKHNVDVYGQVFTPEKIVKKMLSLRKNVGSILEPSAGDGAFMQYLEKNAVGIEIDSRFITDKRVIKKDFFLYSSSNRFNTIIGNPPYVRFKNIEESTRSLLDLSTF